MLLSWSTMAAEAVDSLGNMSKTEILRGIISEKLTKAAQEILAAVERIVAGYEEEASGFRQEIDRQRRQLEVLLQPQVKLETTDDHQLFLVCEPVPEEAAGGAELHEEQEQYKYEPSAEDGGSLGLLLCHTEDQTEEERAARSSTQDQEHLTPLEYETASRSLSPTVQSDRRSAGRRRTSEPQDHVDLRIRILEDSQISVLSTSVFQKYPLQELQCPLGLQEPDFLDLLRSTFPQLAADKPFDVFTTDHSRKLQPLRVEMLTPEEIYSSIKSTGHSALYIRLKAQEEPPVGDKELLLLQREDAAAVDPPSDSSTITTDDKTNLNTRLLSPTVRSDRKKRGRRRTSEPQNHVDLRICILEDSEISVLSTSVFQKYPLQELQCPLGLQEPDFLDLLRSTFPQLAADKPFDVFTTDHSRKLQPLRVETLTPEEIYSSMKSTGHSALYIRLKHLQSADEELQPSQRDAADPQTGHTRSFSPRVRSERRKPGRPRTSEPQNHVDLRIRIVEDSQIHVLSTSVFQKYPLQELQCPLGLQEPDFLDLLRSTFPQLAADKPFDVFTCDRNKRLQPLTVKTLTPEEIDRTIRSIGAGTSALYIRLKEQVEQKKRKKDAAAPDSPSVTDESRLITKSVSPTVQSDRRSAGRRRISEPQDHIDLRIRILEDSQISVLSASVFQKYPLQELQCPLGLQEPDFLDLLRSTFPQLAADEPFDVFTCDRNKRLQPLTVKTLTPEEIDRTIRSIGAGTSALYIRLKEQVEQKKRKKDAAAPDSPSVTDESRLITKSVSPTVQSDRRSAGRRRISEPQDHIDLRIRILEDSQISVLSASVFQKYPLQELQCPLGLQEPDFLDLLRSTFPQLAADKPFDVFTCDRNKRLQPLTVKTLTPEEIDRTIGSIGAGTSALYIRLKEQVEQKKRKKDAAAPDSPSVTDESRLITKSVSPTVQSDRRSAGRRRISEPQDHIDLRIRILEDSQISVLSASVFQKYPLQELQCPLGLQEPDFLDLLRSTFPQLAADKPFDVFTTDHSRKLQLLRVETLTPEEIYSSMKSTGHSALYIRLKEQEETHHLQRKTDSPSTSDETSLHTDSQNIHVQQREEDMEAEEADDDYSTRPEPAKDFLVLSESEEDGDDDWEKISEKTKQRVKRSGVKTKSRKMIQSSPKALTGKSNSLLSCKVCKVLRGSVNMLIKHAWSHVDDPQRVCGVCGEHSESAEEMRSHLQSHQKTHSCNLCGMYFISASGLKGHVARHRREKTYECKICHKEFFQKSALKNHSWVHVEDKPHKCDFCEKSFVSNLNLKVHMTKHTGEKPYHCSVCNKSVRSLESLSQHMRSHSGHTVQERTYECDVCRIRFHTKHQQQAHLKHHFREKPHACSKCSKQFFARASLVTHMRVHTGERPYKCSVCDMAFSQSHCVKRHMKTHENVWMKN